MLWHVGSRLCRQSSIAAARICSRRFDRPLLRVVIAKSWSVVLLTSGGYTE